MDSFIGIVGIFGIFVGWLITYVKFKIDRKDRFRMISIDKRLETHQLAFSFWNRLIAVIHGDETLRMEEVKEARTFWITNCLYLEKETRKRFNEVIGLVDFYHEKLRISKEETDKVEKNKLRTDYLRDWAVIHELPNYIFGEVELEPIVPKLKFNSEGEKL